MRKADKAILAMMSNTSSHVRMEELLEKVDAISGSDIGACADALESYIENADDTTDTAILRCIRYKLQAHINELEMICTEGRRLAQERVARGEQADA